MATNGHFSEHHHDWRRRQHQTMHGISTNGPVDTQGLPVSWKGQLTPERRNELAVRYMPLAKNMARKYRSRPNFAGIWSAARYALLAASLDYHPERKGEFPAFAARRIGWAISAELEREAQWHGWSTSDYNNRRSVLSAQQALRNRLKREPNIDELCEETGLRFDAIEKVVQLLEQSEHRSLDATFTTDDRSLHDLLGEAGFEDTITNDITTSNLLRYRIAEAVAKVTANVSPRDREVFQAAIIAEQTYTEVGEPFGISKQRVGQIVGPLKIALQRELSDIRGSLGV